MCVLTCVPPPLAVAAKVQSKEPKNLRERGTSLISSSQLVCVINQLQPSCNRIRVYTRRRRRTIRNFQEETSDDDTQVPAFPDEINASRMSNKILRRHRVTPIESPPFIQEINGKKKKSSGRKSRRRTRKTTHQDKRRKSLS